MPVNPKLEAIRAETTCPLDTSCGLDMHPDALLPSGSVLVADGSPIAESIFKNGRLGMKALHSTLADATRAVRDISVPTNIATPNSAGKVMRSKVPDEKKPQLHAALMDALGRSVRSYQANLTAAEEGVGKLNAAIDATLADPNAHKPGAAAAASDIRRILLEYNDTQRVHAVTAAIRDNDIEVARAVLSASPFASGLQRVDYAAVRDLAEQQFAPREHAQRAAGHAVLAQMMRAQKLFAERFAGLLPKLEESKSDQSLARLRAGA